jgi:hypothetical protein
MAKKTLDVQGDINFAGGLFQNGTPFTSGGSSQWTSNMNSNTLYYIGNIGIGTTVAKKTLDVQGDINFAGNLYQNNSLYVSSQWTSNLTSNALYYLGSVGIGTTLPFQTLHIQGQSYFTSNVGIGTTIAKKTLDVQGSINSAGTIYTSTQYYNWPSNPIVGRYNLGINNISSNLIVGDSIPDWNGVSALSLGTSLPPIFMRDENYVPYISFTGKNSTNGNYLSFGSQTFNIVTNNGLTFGAYVRFTSDNTYERVFDFGNGAGVNNIIGSRSINTKNLGFDVYAPSAPNLSTTSYNSIRNNEWQAMFFRLQKETATTWSVSIWLNGIQTVTNTVTNSSFVNNYTLANCYVGRSGWSSDSFASMDMREFSVFDRNLSASEILTLSNYYINKYNISIPIQPIIRANENIVTDTQVGIGTFAPIGDLHIYQNTNSSVNFVQNNYKLINTLQPTTITSGAVFGTTCAISGNGLYMAVSAPSSETIYTYYWNEGRWEFLNSFTPSDSAANDSIGSSGIALSEDGTVLVVGTTSKSTNTGKAYVYMLGTGGYTVFTSVTGTTSGDYFGSGLAISGDGYTIVIGAYGRTNTVSQQGVAYVYNLVQGTSGLTLTTTLVAATPTIGGAAAFGNANAISNNGNVIVCGAYLDSSGTSTSGSISIFRKISGTWTARAYAYEPSSTVAAYFGSAVKCSGDGSVIVVAANNYNTATGRVYVYSYRQGVTDSVVLLQQISPSDLTTNTYFSRNIGLSFDAKTIVLCAFGITKAYVYRLNNNQYNIYQQFSSVITGMFGYAVATNGDGSLCIITAPTATLSGLTNVGAAVVYHTNCDMNMTSGRVVINSHSDIVSSPWSRLTVRAISTKTNLVTTTNDTIRLESQDASPCCLTMGLYTSSTATNQGYYINVNEPGVSDARPLLLQPFSTSSYVGIGTFNPTQPLHVNGVIRRIVPVMARRLSAAQTINNVTDTAIKFDAADNFDFNSGSIGLTYNNANGSFTNSSGITQVYNISYQVAYSQNSAGNRVTWIWLNPTSGQGRYAMLNLPSSSDFPVLSCSANIVLSNTETFYIYTWQNSASALSVGGGYSGASSGYSTRVQITLV